MQANRSRDTKPELAVRRLAHARGMRYRVDQRPVKGIRRRADLVFAGPKVAVFIDGCFWHGCAAHYAPPRRNPDYWRDKIGGNVRRDRETDQLLTDAGWTVIRAWEHADPVEVADRVELAVRGQISGTTVTPG